MRIQSTLLSTDVSRSTVAVPRNEKPHRQRSRAHIGRKRHGKAVRPDSCRGTTTRKPPPSPPRRRRQSPREPSNRRRAASHAQRFLAPTPDSMPHASAPPTRNPPRRSLDAQGRTPAGGQQGPRHFFGFFAPCAPRANNAKNCRRETSISMPDFASSLAGTPTLHATHAAQGAPQGRASESKESLRRPAI